LKDTGVLVVSVSLAGQATELLADAALPSGDPDPASLNSWLAVGADESVTVFTGKVDYGQGTETSLAQIVAEELDVPYARIKMDLGDTAKSVDQGITAGSSSLSKGGPQLRQMAAAARQELLKLAAVRLQTPVDKLTVSEGVVSAAETPAKKISYGKLIGGKRFEVKIAVTGTGWGMTVAPDVHAKDFKDYKVVGVSEPRADLPAKFTGEFTYVQDVRVPGMLHGRAVRPKAVLSMPSKVDESSIRDIPGVVKVVQVGSFVGVVAETEWAAIQAANNLKVTWSTPATKMPATRDELYAYLRDTKVIPSAGPSGMPGQEGDKGNLETGFSQASKSFAATFRWPFHMHGMLAPPCAVADVKGSKATVWTGTQGPLNAREMVAKTLGLQTKDVHVIYKAGAGSYGRTEVDDTSIDAALLSQAVGRPVRVQWMREEENHWEPKASAQLITVRAGVDASGKLVAWDFLDRSFPWTENHPNPWLASQQVGLKPVSPGMSIMSREGGGVIYNVANQKIATDSLPWRFAEPIPLRSSNLRAPGQVGTCFASESFIDEIAADLQVDPVAFRLRYLNHSKRHMEVLRAAASKAGWQERPSPAAATSGSKAAGRGVALVDRSSTIVAAVAEVEVDKSTGKVTVKKVTVAHDCGRIVNPDGLKNQIEGNVVYGMSRTLLEEVEFDEYRIKNLDWSSYPIVTFADAPETEVVLINHPELEPTGAGEAASCAMPAAIANAVFDAVGVRLREVPLTPQRILNGLKAGPGGKAS
jgi:CO/xanthine dehydrogenase Mo-binding subunit